MGFMGFDHIPVGFNIFHVLESFALLLSLLYYLYMIYKAKEFRLGCRIFLVFAMAPYYIILFTGISLSILESEWVPSEYREHYSFELEIIKEAGILYIPFVSSALSLWAYSGKYDLFSSRCCRVTFFCLLILLLLPTANAYWARAFENSFIIILLFVTILISIYQFYTLRNIAKFQSRVLRIVFVKIIMYITMTQTLSVLVLTIRRVIGFPKFVEESFHEAPEICNILFTAIMISAYREKKRRQDSSSDRKPNLFRMSEMVTVTEAALSHFNAGYFPENQSSGRTVFAEEVPSTANRKTSEPAASSETAVKNEDQRLRAVRNNRHGLARGLATRTPAGTVINAVATTIPSHSNTINQYPSSLDVTRLVVPRISHTIPIGLNDMPGLVPSSSPILEQNATAAPSVNSLERDLPKGSRGGIYSQYLRDFWDAEWERKEKLKRNGGGSSSSNVDSNKY